MATVAEWNEKAEMATKWKIMNVYSFSLKSIEGKKSKSRVFYDVPAQRGSMACAWFFVSLKKRVVLFVFIFELFFCYCCYRCGYFSFVAIAPMLPPPPPLFPSNWKAKHNLMERNMEIYWPYFFISIQSQVIVHQLFISSSEYLGLFRSFLFEIFRKLGS